MNPIERIRNFFRPKNEINYIGRESFRISNPGYDAFCSNDTFASAYPSVRPISDEIMQVRPYAVDGKGEKLKQTPQVLYALAHPNQLDSEVLFRKKLATSILSNSNTYVLVWRKEGDKAYAGGTITPNNIIGFTFLEGYSVVKEDGIIKYKQGELSFTQNEVLAFPGGVNGFNLNAGYSPTTGALQWLKLDDYIADYNKGMFANGAVPAGQFIITAKSVQDFKDIKSGMQNMHRGAGKNNNVMYTYQPVGADGKPANAQIQWIPFANNNKDMAIDVIFNQVNRKIDQAYGVPAIVKGSDESANYATAEVSDRNFAKYTVKPLLTLMWSQFTHELNRITGGLGYALNYDYEIPAISDAEKVKAETNILNMNIITTMTTAGYSLDSIINAFELPESLYNLEMTNIPEHDEVDVDEGDEVKQAPDQTTLTYNRTKNEHEHHDHEHDHIHMESTDPQTVKFEKKIKSILKDVHTIQINRAIDLLVDNMKIDITNPVEESDDDLLFNKLNPELMNILLHYGEEDFPEQVELVLEAGIKTDDLKPFTLTAEQKQAYEEYVMKVAKSHNDTVANEIRKVLVNAQEEGLPVADIKKQLKSLISKESLLNNLAVSEVNRAGNTGSLYSMKNIASELDITVYKVWDATIDMRTCGYCRSMHGTKVKLDENFREIGDLVEEIDENGNKTGKFIVNNFVPMATADSHSMCRCSQVYQIEK